MYLFCSLTIKSNIEIPELPPSKRDSAQFFFYLENCYRGKAIPAWSPLLSTPDGDRFISFYRDLKSLWLRFERLADFQISEGGKKISCYPMVGIPEETIRHLFIDQVMPRCLAYQGKIIVHGSAVQHSHGLLIFLGDSGVGKSTLAGDFHQAGMPALSDDCVLIKESRKRIVAVPSYASLRLWEDSADTLFASMAFQSIAHYSAKRQLLLDEQGIPGFYKGLPVISVIVLSHAPKNINEEIMLTSLSCQQAYIEFIKHTFQLFMNDPVKIENHMKKLARIIPMLPVYRLNIPHNYDLLSVVRNRILSEAVQY